MSGIELIAQERQRQIKDKAYFFIAVGAGVTSNEELARAASCYALPERYRERAFWEGEYDGFKEPENWPWSGWYWNPSRDRIEELVKAGALIAAEIDRLQEIEAKENDQ